MKFMSMTDSDIAFILKLNVKSVRDWRYSTDLPLNPDGLQIIPNATVREMSDVLHEWCAQRGWFVVSKYLHHHDDPDMLALRISERAYVTFTVIANSVDHDDPWWRIGVIDVQLDDAPVFDNLGKVSARRVVKGL